MPTDRRGQSEAVGFALVFGMIVATIALVSVAGYGGLQDARDAREVDNAERAFAVLGDNVDDVARHGAPSRATELKLAGAEVYLGDPVTFNVTGHATGSAATFGYERSVRPVVYDADAGSRLVYTAGAVIREDRGGTIVTQRPNLVLNRRRTTFQLVQTRPSLDTTRSVGGTSTVLVRTGRADAEVLRANATEYDLTLTVTSPRADAWERYLDGMADVTCTRPSSRTVSCTLTTDRVYVSVVRVDVTLE